MLLALVCLPTMALTSRANADDSLQVGTQRVGKILFLGNSITLHGPAPKIGWTGNWGMAATSQDKDYVHQLLGKISKATGHTPKVMIRNIADFERHPMKFNIGEALKEELAFEADMVILAIGENAPSPTTEEARQQFATALKDLLAQLSEHGKPTLFVRSQFWPDATKDKFLKEACQNAGGIFVDISRLGADPSNAARSERQIEHAGVAGHPGDKGMAAIAEELWQAIKQSGEAKKSP